MRLNGFQPDGVALNELINPLPGIARGMFAEIISRAGTDLGKSSAKGNRDPGEGRRNAGPRHFGGAGLTLG